MIVPVIQIKFVVTKGLPMLLVINKNQDLQRIYCGVTKM